MGLAPSVRFTVLGPVEILGPDGSVPTAPRHRAVLAYLLLNAGRVCSAERLIDAVWGMDAPETARSQIHAGIAAIRRALRAAGAPGVVVTRPAGYVALPETGQLDLQVFTDEVAAADGDPRVVIDRLRAALTLWHGDPLADIHADFVPAERARLIERRSVAFDKLMDAELAAGRHEDILDELIAQVGAFPFREKNSAQLVLALHRSGRQTDALVQARRFRTRLAEEQGLDPGRAFTELEQAVLRDDPALRPPTPGPAATPSAATTTVPANAETTSSATAPAAGTSPATGIASTNGTVSANDAPPNFLPYDLPDFSGREAEVALLTAPPERSRPGTVITAIDGMAGAGKTALAVRISHLLAECHPDGQLFVDLQAHTAGAEPVTAEAALATLLHQLGLPYDRIPETSDARGARWRAEMARRKVVVVLDNVRDSEQVRPLLPGSSPSTVILTSRRRLVDLDGARALSVDMLPARDAVELFGRIVGPRAAAEPAAVLDVLRLCGFLPLAVRIAAARLSHRPRWTVGYLADRLRDHRRRLAELTTADRGVAAAFALSYDQLPAEPQRMFRLLGLQPGHDIGPAAAGALAGCPLDDAETALEELLDAHVITQRQPGRYTLHDLLREQARATAAVTEPPEAIDAALHRLLDHYLHTARDAVDLLFPYTSGHRNPLPTSDIEREPLAGPAAAAAWLDAERDNLVAAGCWAERHDSPAHAVGMAATLRPYVDGNGHHGEAQRLHTAALTAAARLGDATARSRALTDLGWTAWRRGDYDTADEWSRQALTATRDAANDYDHARALNTLGNVAWRRRDPRAAREYFEAALDLARADGNRVGEAHVLGNLGPALDHTGDTDLARAHLNRALALHRELGNHRGEALVHTYLGTIDSRHGDHIAARGHHRRAAELYRALGSPTDEAAARNGLGVALCDSGDPAAALAEHRTALELGDQHSHRPEQARAHDRLARALHRLDRRAEAREHAEHALTLYLELDVPEAEDVRTFLTGLSDPVIP
ncbi:AfsR/SARP family transcriptional regulator [Nocardia terrae]|nr:BTAD domain-containing putative transcriptional regulator [Nocardia terrae]